MNVHICENVLNPGCAFILYSAPPSLRTDVIILEVKFITKDRSY